jgi:hypothetical protein
LREGFIDYQENSQVKEFCASINSKAEFINLDLKQSQETTGTFKALLNRYNL